VKTQTHEELKATASKLFDSGKLTIPESREASRLYMRRKWTRKDKESLAQLASRYL
jgi:hypothetical protein